ncbi:hypothetical protein KIN20_014583 [Parelaphostrongylus tenuis]|uniref:Uncharacterized protein n=1 Tax=Parelaphostrongylus tenuis TaxID=148309 RepID=A0AAD5N3F0_PARTN|nr:hypothetical protein KIN20_014583 [Parelaphostrongylus tenuis]
MSAAKLESSADYTTHCETEGLHLFEETVTGQAIGTCLDGMQLERNTEHPISAHILCQKSPRKIIL